MKYRGFMCIYCKYFHENTLCDSLPCEDGANCKKFEYVNPNVLL